MVRALKYTYAFLRLIRIQNLLIIAATMCIFRWAVFTPLLRNDDFEPQLSTFLFLLLVVATLALAAAGYVINDYFDRKADLINRPGKVILGRILRRRAGMIWHMVLTSIGILLGIYISYTTNHIKLSLVFFLISGVLWFYSTTYKRQVLLGNIIVAVLVAMVPLIILVFELPLILKKYQYYFIAGPTDVNLLIAWVVGYAVFAFLLTLLREIVKDLEDFEGDFAFGRQTIPIAWGVDVAKRIIYVASIITLALIAFVLYKFKWSPLTIIYGLVLVAIPLIFFYRMIYKADKKEDYTKTSLILKIIMLAGLAYTVIAAIWVF